MRSIFNAVSKKVKFIKFVEVEFSVSKLATICIKRMWTPCSNPWVKSHLLEVRSSLISRIFVSLRRTARISTSTSSRYSFKSCAQRKSRGSRDSARVLWSRGSHSGDSRRLNSYPFRTLVSLLSTSRPGRIRPFLDKWDSLKR